MPTTLSLTHVNDLLLFGTAFLAGGLNAVAGGGSFITFPALIFTGTPPIAANATNTTAMLQRDDYHECFEVVFGNLL
jgi:uncharacterized membrane protein YfcA